MVILCKVYEAVVKWPDPSIPAALTTAVHAATGGSTTAMAVALGMATLAFVALGFEARLRSYLERARRRWNPKRLRSSCLPSAFSVLPR